jgi:predicted metal-dependent peptidase
MNTDAFVLGKVRLARDRMLETFPYHAHVLAAGRFQVERVGTMAVTIRGGQLYFLLDPRFVVKHTLDELTAVLEHEVNHVVFGHLEVDRTTYPDRDARLIAEEVTANEFVRGKLPGRPHLLADYDLPAGESTDERYTKLEARRKSVPSRSNSVHGQANSVPAGSGSGPAKKKRVPKPRIRSTDNHVVWPSPAEEDVAGVIMGVFARAAAATPASLVPAIVRRRLRRCNEDPQAERITLMSVPAAHRLLAILERHQKAIANFRRPSRRLPALVGIVPRIERKPLRVVFIVDTSASISSDVLGRVSALIRKTAQVHAITVIEADDAVRQTYRYSRPITFVHGRGSTDLRPALAQALGDRLRPDVIVYATDGDGPAPSVAPTIPLIWLLTPGGVSPANWGQVVALE